VYLAGINFKIKMTTNESKGMKKNGNVNRQFQKISPRDSSNFGEMLFKKRIAEIFQIFVVVKSTHHNDQKHCNSLK